MTSLIDADSILVMDIGSNQTLAILFDVVDGRYRFIAKGGSPGTVMSADNDISGGVQQALRQLQEITGRKLIDAKEQLIIPSVQDGIGVDRVVACISAGRPLEVVVVSLLDNLSGESALRLAQTTYSVVKEMISLNDRRNPEERLNLLIRARPDLVIACGGTNSGASKSIINLLETVGLACYLLPESIRPGVFFAGNETILDEVKSTLEPYSTVRSAPNIRPNQEKEDLVAAQSVLANIFVQQRVKTVKGLEQLKSWTGDGLFPTAACFGRVVQFLSAVLKEKKGVLGVDLGASAPVVAAAMDRELSLAVFPELGLTVDRRRFLELIKPEDVAKWVAAEISKKEILEYIYYRWLYPGSIPGSMIENEIEHAITRQVLQQAIQMARPGFPKTIKSRKGEMLPEFEPILATGGIFAHSHDQVRNALLLLDGLQPAGITTLIVDQNQIAPSIGASAAVNPLSAVQVLDSNAFLNLGTVIAPIANARAGQPVLRYKLIYESGHEIEYDVKQGSLETISLSAGQNAQLILQPLHGADIGMGSPGRGGKLIVKGGMLGVIIDARGRPLRLSEDPAKRRELYAKWIWNLGAQ